MHHDPASHRCSDPGTPTPPPTLLAAALLWLSCPGCGGSGGDDGTALVGVRGGLVAVRQGELAGAALQVPAGALPGNQVLRMLPAAAPGVEGFVGVGPAARIVPADLEFLLPATLTLPFAAGHPEVLANDPAEDLVVLRDRPDGFLQVLPPAGFDLQAGTVQVEVEGLGTFRTAVRPSAAAFALEPYLPRLDDWFAYHNQQSLLVRDAAADPNLGQAPWLAWELLPSIPNPPISPARPQHGFYLLPRGDGSMLLGGFYERGSGFLAREQILAVEPLVLPATVAEGDTLQQPAVFDLYSPFGATTPVRTGGTLRVAFGRRRAASVHAGTFGDTLEARFELEMPGRGTRSLRVELARGVGPVVFEEVTGFPGELVWASARGRIFQ